MRSHLPTAQDLEQADQSPVTHLKAEEFCD